MTENEIKAIKWIKNVRDDAVITLDHIQKNEPNVSPTLYAGRKKKAETIMEMCEELEQYRTIGTVEELKKIEESFNTISDEVWNYILAGEELLERYETIGTIEEFKNLKKKSVAKKPKYQKIQYGKHKWKRKENGEIDDFAWDYAYCNGVVCEVCGETQCVHCNPKYDKLKDCEVEDYFCPTCNETVGYFHSHCKHCWQKLDWQ